MISHESRSSRLTCGVGRRGEEQDGEGELHLGDGVVVGVGLVADLTCRVRLMSTGKKQPPFMGENAKKSDM